MRLLDSSVLQKEETTSCIVSTQLHSLSTGLAPSIRIACVAVHRLPEILHPRIAASDNRSLLSHHCSYHRLASSAKIICRAEFQLRQDSM